MVATYYQIGRPHASRLLYTLRRSLSVGSSEPRMNNYFFAEAPSLEQPSIPSSIGRLALNTGGRLQRFRCLRVVTFSIIENAKHATLPRGDTPAPKWSDESRFAPSYAILGVLLFTVVWMGHKARPVRVWAVVRVWRPSLLFSLTAADLVNRHCVFLLISSNVSFNPRYPLAAETSVSIIHLSDAKTLCLPLITRIPPSCLSMFINVNTPVLPETDGQMFACFVFCFPSVFFSSCRKCRLVPTRLHFCFAKFSAYALFFLQKVQIGIKVILFCSLQKHNKHLFISSTEKRSG